MKCWEKLLSGRWILTIIVGVAFLRCVWTNTLSKEAIASIIVAVFISYFEKRRNGEEKK